MSNAQANGASGKSNRARLAARLRQARQILWWERFWRLAWPVPALLALFLGIAGLDLLPRLPGWAHALVLLIFLGTLVWLLLRLRHASRPTLVEARRRLELDSNLPHRPLAALSDKLATGGNDGIARALWREQRRRHAVLLAHLRLAPPRPDLPSHDPHAIRFAPLLLLAMGLMVGWHDFGARLGRAVTPPIASLAGPPAQLQVWITPPPYTRLAPVILQAQADGQTIKVPEGSKLLAELQGGHGGAELVLGDKKQPFQRLDKASQRLETALAGSGKLSVRQGWFGVASWDLSLVANTPPHVAFTDPPSADPQNQLKVDISADDQYGIAKAWVTITRPELADAKPVTVDLPITTGEPTKMTSSSVQDLTANPWAGLKVTMRPSATDVAGLTASGNAVEVTLPEREFHNPLARAVIALRKALAQNPDERDPVIYGLTILMARPSAFGDDMTVYLGLSGAWARLRRDESADAVPSVLDTLWQTALRLEDGDKPEAQQRLDQARAALDAALAQHAPQSEIDGLTQELRTAINNLLQSMLAQAAKNPAPPPTAQQMSQAITMQDLNAMIDRLQQLAQTGSPEAARQALAELSKLLDALKNAQIVQAGPQAGQAQQTLNDLNNIARDQRNLLDQTFRNGRGQQQQSGSAAAQMQQALRMRLGQAMQAMGDMGAPLPDQLGQAEQSMRAAEQALRNGDTQGAMQAQNDALGHLQAGMQQAQNALSPQTGNVAQAPGGVNGHDPLGRPMVEGSGSSDDGSVKVPTQTDVQKAREVLDELRRRASDANRSPGELDYLNRLLQQFQ